MVRIALYARVSPDDQGIVSQAVTLRRYAADKGATVVADGDSDLFVDEGFSGKNLDRPAFQRVMDAVRRGEVDEVVVFKVDRLSRSIIDFLSTVRELAEYGASVTSVTQPFTNATPEGRLMMNMLMSFGEFEREMIADRTARAAKIRKADGLTFGPAPYGFINKDGKLAPDPATWCNVVALANGARGIKGLHPSTAWKVRKRIRASKDGTYYGHPLVAVHDDDANRCGL